MLKAVSDLLFQSGKVERFGFVFHPYLGNRGGAKGGRGTAGRVGRWHLPERTLLSVRNSPRRLGVLAQLRGLSARSDSGNLHQKGKHVTRRYSHNDVQNPKKEAGKMNKNKQKTCKIEEAESFLFQGWRIVNTYTQTRVEPCLVKDSVYDSNTGTCTPSEYAAFAVTDCWCCWSATPRRSSTNSGVR